MADVPGRLLKAVVCLQFPHFALGAESELPLRAICRYGFVGSRGLRVSLIQETLGARIRVQALGVSLYLEVAPEPLAGREVVADGDVEVQLTWMRIKRAIKEFLRAHGDDSLH